MPTNVKIYKKPPTIVTYGRTTWLIENENGDTLPFIATKAMALRIAAFFGATVTEVIED